MRSVLDRLQGESLVVKGSPFSFMRVLRALHRVSSILVWRKARLEADPRHDEPLFNRQWRAEGMLVCLYGIFDNCTWSIIITYVAFLDERRKVRSNRFEDFVVLIASQTDLLLGCYRWRWMRHSRAARFECRCHIGRDWHHLAFACLFESSCELLANKFENVSANVTKIQLKNLKALQSRFWLNVLKFEICSTSIKCIVTSYCR